jgi:hypothetical protein
MSPAAFSVQHMSSSTLRRRHRTAYERLWQRSHWVASSPGVFIWAGEHVALDGALLVCQQVPLRVYVGLEDLPEVGGHDFSLRLGSEDGDHKAFDMSAGRFVSFQWKARSVRDDWAVTREGFSRDLEAVLNALALYLQLRRRFVVRTLHELPREGGADWSGAFSAALVGALFAAAGLGGDIDRTLRNCEPGRESESELLAALNQWAWRVERILHGGRASGYGTTASIARLAQPLLFTGKEISQTLQSDSQGVSLEAHYVPLCTTQEWYAHAGFDYGLIDTGVAKCTAARIGDVRTHLAEELHVALKNAEAHWPGGASTRTVLGASVIISDDGTEPTSPLCQPPVRRFALTNQ